MLEIRSVIDQYNEDGLYGDLFPSNWLPASVAIINEPFTIDNALLSSTGKMIRAKIIECYKDKIDYLYTPEGKSIVNPKNIEAIRQILNLN